MAYDSRIVFMTEKCTCKQHETFALDGKPEYYTSETDAIHRWIFSQANLLYYAIHLHGNHILNIHIPDLCVGGKLCKVCYPKSTMLDTAISVV